MNKTFEKFEKSSTRRSKKKRQIAHQSRLREKGAFGKLRQDTATDVTVWLWFACKNVENDENRTVVRGKRVQVKQAAIMVRWRDGCMMHDPGNTGKIVQVCAEWSLLRTKQFNNWYFILEQGHTLIQI